VSTDYQQAREALGARLRELRTEAGLNGKEFAERLGWQRSKVSRLENGKQTAAAADLEAWAQGAGRPNALEELKRSLRGLETAYRSWKRQLAAGHRAVQEGHVVQEAQAETIHLFESGIIPGVFQTPEYARGVLADVSNRLGTPRDIEEGGGGRTGSSEAPRGAVRAGAPFPRPCLGGCPARRALRAARRERTAGPGGHQRARPGPVPMAPVPPGRALLARPLRPAAARPGPAPAERGARYRRPGHRRAVRAVPGSICDLAGSTALQATSEPHTQMSNLAQSPVSCARSAAFWRSDQPERRAS
jgi:transcriptional regulator with XRE-family HTH domain